jgi:hypothetical protein
MDMNPRGMNQMHMNHNGQESKWVGIKMGRNQMDMNQMDMNQVLYTLHINLQPIVPHGT